MNKDILTQAFLYCHSDPFPLFLVCKEWNSIQQNDQFWKQLSVARWPPLSVLPFEYHHQVAWKDLFKKRHSMAMGPFQTQYNNLSAHYQSISPPKKDFDFSQQSQYFMDSVLYSEVEVEEEMEDGESEEDAESLIYTNQTRGTMMTLKGETVSFSFECSWHTFSNSDGSYWGWDNHIQVSDARFVLPEYISSAEREHEKWVAQVRDIIGWSGSSLSDVWDVIKIIVTPSTNVYSIHQILRYKMKNTGFPGS